MYFKKFKKITGIRKVKFLNETCCFFNTDRINKPFAPSTPFGLGAFFSSSTLKSTGMSLDDGGLYSCKKIINKIFCLVTLFLGEYKYDLNVVITIISPQ